MWTKKRECPAWRNRMSKTTRREENTQEPGRWAGRGCCRKGGWKDGPFRWQVALNASRVYDSV